ncbi:MAG: hypothetical protein KDA44_19930 [Planctomycetales bacterium]|nr:hypothetical protein [Planctomycetales bacterium]
MPPKPIVLDDHQKAEVETLAALLNQDQIADYFGISRTTFHMIRQRDPEVDERYKRGKSKAIAHVANGLLQKARAGDTTSSIFYLKTQAGWRETTHLEHSVPEGGPNVETTALNKLLGKLQELRDRSAELAPLQLSAVPQDDAG